MRFEREGVRYINHHASVRYPAQSFTFSVSMILSAHVHSNRVICYRPA